MAPINEVQLTNELSTYTPEAEGPYVNSVMVKGGVVGGDVKSPVTGNSKGESETKRTENELKATIVTILKKYGLSNVSMETICSILEISSGKKMNELLDVDDEEVEKIFKTLGYIAEEAAIFAKNGNEDINKILVELANGYKAAEQKNIDLDKLHNQKRNAYAKITGILSNAGLNNISKSTMDAIIEASTGKKVDCLVDVSDKEIEKAAERLEKYVIKEAKAEAKKNNCKIDDILVRISGEYKLAADDGLDLDNLRKSGGKKAESLCDRMMRFYYKLQPQNWNEMSPEEKQEYWENNVTKTKKKECIKSYFSEYLKDDANKQIKDFTKLLANTPENDRILFLDVAKSLLAENRCHATWNVFLIQYTQKGKTAIANEIIDLKNAKSLYTEADINGNYVKEDEVDALYVEVSKFMDEKGMKAGLKAANEDAPLTYTEENIALYNELKLKKAEDLTKEEIKFIKEFEFQAHYRGDMMIGLANSDVITDEEFIKSTLSQMNSDAYEYANPVYYEMLENIANYVEAHPKTLNMSLEDFNNLINQVTGGNYLNVQEGRDIIEPNGEITSPDNISEGGLGFVLKGDRPMVSNPSIDNTVIVPDNTEVDAEHNTHTTADSYFADGVTVNKVMHYFSELGSVRAVQEILNSNALKGTFAEVIAWYRYGISSPEEKLLVVEGMNYGSNKIKAARQLGPNGLSELIASSDNIQEIQTYEDLLQTKRQENNLLTRIGNLVTK